MQSIYAAPRTGGCTAAIYILVRARARFALLISGKGGDSAEGGIFMHDIVLCIIFQYNAISYIYNITFQYNAIY